MSNVRPALFEDLPYTLRDELEFAIADVRLMVPDWNHQAPKTVFVDDGFGYAAPAKNLLGDRKHTFKVQIDGEAFVYNYTVDQWMIVGEDI